MHSKWISVWERKNKIYISKNCRKYDVDNCSRENEENGAGSRFQILEWPGNALIIVIWFKAWRSEIFKKNLEEGVQLESSEGQVPEARTFHKCLPGRARRWVLLKRANKRENGRERRSAQIKSLQGLIDLCNLVFWLSHSQITGLWRFYFEQKKWEALICFIRLSSPTEFRIKWGRARWKKGVRGFLHSSWWNMMDQMLVVGWWEMVTFWICFEEQRE